MTTSNGAPTPASVTTFSYKPYAYWNIHKENLKKNGEKKKPSSVGIPCPCHGTQFGTKFEQENRVLYLNICSLKAEVRRLNVILLLPIVLGRKTKKENSPGSNIIDRSYNWRVKKKKKKTYGKEWKRNLITDHATCQRTQARSADFAAEAHLHSRYFFTCKV